MQALPQDGAMLTVFAQEAQVAAALAEYDGEVSIAAVNGPENIMISGKRQAVVAIQACLASEGIRTKRSTTPHAFHSPLMEPALKDFRCIASQVRFAAPNKELVSNLNGQQFKPGQAPDAAYWCRHLSEAVQFSAGVSTLYEAGYRVFIEIGPGTTLLGMGRRCLPQSVGQWLPSLRKGQGEWRQMLMSLKALYLQGIEVNWAGFDRSYSRHLVSLPTYPFQRRRYWLDKVEEACPSAIAAQARTTSQVAHTSFDLERDEGQPKESESSSETSELLKQLNATAPSARCRLLAIYIRDQVVAVAGMDPTQTLDIRQPLNELGVDSLMALEIADTLGLALGRTLSPALVYDYPTIEALAEHLVDVTCHTHKLAGPRQERLPEVDLLGEILAKLEPFSEAEAEALLRAPTPTSKA